MNKALFFDLDGTLWDAIEPLIDSYNLTMKEKNLSYVFDYSKVKSLMGLTPLETSRLVFKDMNDEEGLELFKYMVIEEIKYLKNHPGKLYPNEIEVLEKLSKKYPLYIVSNCEKGYIENYLNSLNMNKYFKGHTCIGDTGLDKWQNILLLKEKEHIDELIYIGDTLKDKKESEKAKVKFIHAKYGFGAIEDDEFYIDSLLELEDKVEKVFSK